MNELMVRQADMFWRRLSRFYGDSMHFNSITRNQRYRKAIKRAWERYLRRKEKLDSINLVVKTKGGRPKKEDKKIAISLKLPPYLLAWMDEQPENRAVLIETALTRWYKIPSHTESG